MMQTSRPTLQLLTASACYRDDPTALFHQLCGARPATLLLESAEVDNKQNLKSLLVIDSALRITALGQTVTLEALTRNGLLYYHCWMPVCPLKSIFRFVRMAES